MKYMITLTDEQLKHFRLDDNGKTLVLTDALGGTRAFPIESVLSVRIIQDHAILSIFAVFKSEEESEGEA